MASGSVKHNVDCAADSSDWQISKINSFVFGTWWKWQIHVFFWLFGRETLLQSSKVLLNVIKIGGIVHLFFLLRFFKYRDTYHIVRAVSWYVSNHKASVSLHPYELHMIDLHIFCFPEKLSGRWSIRINGVRINKAPLYIRLIPSMTILKGTVYLFNKQKISF
jgi:hypothetical protein